MRRATITALFLAMLLVCLTAGAWAAEKTTADKLWRYELDGDVAQIKAYLGREAEVTVPAEIDGHPTAILSLQASIESLTIPVGVRAICSGAFYHADVQHVRIESSETGIEAEAFSSCDALVSIVLPDGWTSLPEMCFNGCGALTEIHLPRLLTSIGDACFSGCEKLAEITLPSGLVTIGNSAFSRCTSLSAIEIPERVTAIGTSAFAYCKALERISLPDSVTSLDTSSSVFSGCSALQTVCLPATLTGRLRNYFFSDCAALESITLPDGITELGREVFHGCSSLRMVTLPKQLAGVLGEDDDHGPFLDTNVTSFYAAKGTWAYDYGLSKGWAYVSANPFAWSQTEYRGYVQDGVQLLWTGEAPDRFDLDADFAAISAEGYLSATRPGIITIVAEADGVNSEVIVLLRDKSPLVLPASVEILEEEAFANTGCMEIILPEGLRHLGPRVFANCEKLGIVVLPDSLTQLDTEALAGCEDVHFLLSIDNPLSVWLGEHNYRYWAMDEL